MVDSRLKLPPPRLLECFVEVLAESDADDGQGVQTVFSYPEEFDNKEQMLKEIGMFCFPCKTDSPGVQYFSFVLTDIDHKFRFGFCRYPPHAPSCLCILSYVPWFETFYHILDDLAALSKSGDQDAIVLLLDELASCEVPEPATSLTVTLSSIDRTFIYVVPDTTKLPTIPENRNLTDYFASVTPENMVHLFISMLFERRILITSEKLNMLTSVIHGSVSLLYPMQWQHIYIPVLPPHLISFCCAPMPFLIGVHSSIMEEVRTMPIEDVVIFNVDTNVIESPFPDLETFPTEVSLRLRSKLKRTEKAYGDYVATQFLKALVKVIGGYRDALKFKDTPEGGKIVFDEDAFLCTRSGSLRRFLEEILNLQSFRQFVAGRIEMLDEDIIFEDVFELELSNEVGADKSKYQKTWVSKMKKSSDALGRKMGHRYLNLKAKANDMELKTKMRSFYKEAKTGVRTGYKGAKAQIKDVKHKLKTKEGEGDESPNPVNPVKRQSSFPAAQMDLATPGQDQQKQNQFRHSLYSTMPANRVHHKGSTKRNTMSVVAPKPRRPPPRPPRPDCLPQNQHASPEASPTQEKASQSDASPVDKAVNTRLLDVASMCESRSEPSIATLIDLRDTERDCAEHRSNPELLPGGGRCNAAFNLLDDHFYHIDEELIPPMECRSLESTPPSVRPVRDDVATGDLSPFNPDHFDRPRLNLDLDDEFVYVSSSSEIMEGSLDSLTGSPERRSFPGKRQPSYKSATNPMYPNSVDEPTSASSLFSETFHSMSNETKNLFFNGSSSSDQESTNPFRSPGASTIRRQPPCAPPKTIAEEPTNSGDPFEDLIAQTKSSMNIKHADVI